MGCETKKRYVAHVCNACMSVHGLLQRASPGRQNADGIRQCAIACTDWASLHMLEMVLREQRDAVSQRNVGS